MIKINFAYKFFFIKAINTLDIRKHNELKLR